MDDTCISSSTSPVKRRRKFTAKKSISGRSRTAAPPSMSSAEEVQWRPIFLGVKNPRLFSIIVKQSFSTEKAIGRKGGVIEFLGCSIRFPPEAFNAETLVKIVVRSIYDDAPQGYVAVSPEIECSVRMFGGPNRMFGGPLQRYATISLPVHAMPLDHPLTVVTKQNQECNWEVMGVDLTFEKRLVTFQVHHFSIFKIFSRFVPWLKMHLCHNLYYKASTSQLIGVTCLDDPAVKKTCQSLEKWGFKALSSLPDEFTLTQDEVMSYRYACSNPKDSFVLPENEVVLTRHDFKSSFYAKQWFMLVPPPKEGTNVVSLRYFLLTPQRGRLENRIGLEWNQTATPQIPPQYGDAPHSANITSARERAAAAGRDIYTYIVYNICQAESIIIWVLIAIVCCLVAVYFSQYK